MPGSRGLPRPPSREAAGAEQTRLWRSYCATAEPEEFFTKVGFEETRDYLRRVLTSWAQYERLY